MIYYIINYVVIVEISLIVSWFCLYQDPNKTLHYIYAIFLKFILIYWISLYYFCFVLTIYVHIQFMHMLKPTV